MNNSSAGMAHGAVKLSEMQRSNVIHSCTQSLRVHYNAFVWILPSDSLKGSLLLICCTDHPQELDLNRSPRNQINTAENNYSLSRHYSKQKGIYLSNIWHHWRFGPSVSESLGERNQSRSLSRPPKAMKMSGADT